MFLTYETWQELEHLTTDVGLPNLNDMGTYVIAKNGSFRVYWEQQIGNTGMIVLGLLDRELRLDFSLDEWKKFHSMILNAGAPEPIPDGRA